MYRILSGEGSKTTTELVETGGARQRSKIKSLTVQNTTLDDVFVHYTGRQLRDEQVKATRVRDAGPSGDAAMNRMWAIVERELRKFFRSPALMLVSMVFPLVQLIVLGNAFGGKINDAQAGRGRSGPRNAGGEVREAFAAVQANADTFQRGLLRQRPAGDGRRAVRQASRARSSFRRSIRASSTNRTIRASA